VKLYIISYFERGTSTLKVGKGTLRSYYIKYYASKTYTCRIC